MPFPQKMNDCKSLLTSVEVSVARHWLRGTGCQTLVARCQPCQMLVARCRLLCDRCGLDEDRAAGLWEWVGTVSKGRGYYMSIVSTIVWLGDIRNSSNISRQQQQYVVRFLEGKQTVAQDQKQQTASAASGRQQPGGVVYQAISVGLALCHWGQVQAWQPAGLRLRPDTGLEVHGNYTDYALVYWGG